MKKASIEPVAQNCFQQLAQVAIYIGNGGRSDYAKCHPSICILQMGVKFFNAGINCPNFSGCDWCQHITWCHFICIDHQMKLLLALCHGFRQQLVPWTSLLVHQLEKSAQIRALHWHGLPIQCDQIKIYQQWSRTGLLLGECLGLPLACSFWSATLEHLLLSQISRLVPRNSWTCMAPTFSGG